jgi:hypothetical protein
MSKRIGKYKVSKREDLLSLANGGTIDGKMVWGSETLTEDGDAANPNIPITIMDHDGDEGITLADGTEVGQLKIFISSTNNTVTLTPATTAGAYSTIATTDIGTSFSCVWTGDGWAVISRASGATANASTVASYPVLA